MPLGRKSLSSYDSDMSESPNSPKRRVDVSESVSNEETRTSRTLRSSASPKNPPQRSASPKKPSAGIYPNLNGISGSKSYDTSPFIYSASLYPNIDRESFAEEDQQINQSIDQTPLDVHGDSASPHKAFPSPVPPLRRRKGQADSPVSEGTANGNDELKEKKLPAFPLPLLIVAGICLLLSIGVLCSYFLRQESTQEVRMQEFKRNFGDFSRNYSQEMHRDSLEMLHGALENHVIVAAKKDKANQYPTCVLLAADETNVDTLNCVTDDISRMIPPRGNVDPRLNVHVVNLTDSRANHKNPDEEDLRSRVHHAINAGFNEGAKVIVFRNIEALVPNDIPLLELFYSYCDGENPTFPQTLWLMTLVTRDLPALKASKFPKEKNIARSVAGTVEKYLESILENRTIGAQETTDHVNKNSRNPILTRIANYIVPILNVGRITQTCSRRTSH